VVGQMGNENFCFKSGGACELLCWVRWGMRTDVVGQMSSENCCGGSDVE
jgi:hypothetical protein